MGTGTADDPPDEATQSRWCLVANLVKESVTGESGDLRHGTKHFTGGTKVYFHSAYWGMGADSVTVFGRGRRGKRWIKVTLGAHYLENWRAKVIYEPPVLAALADDEIQGQEHVARSLADSFGRRTPRMRLIEHDLEAGLAVAAGLGRDGLKIAHASAGSGEPNRTVVLYDRAAPAAVLAFRRPEKGSLMFWREVWIVDSRQQAMADLVYAVQTRFHDQHHIGGDDLIRGLRSTDGT